MFDYSSCSTSSTSKYIDYGGRVTMEITIVVILLNILVANML